MSVFSRYCLETLCFIVLLLPPFVGLSQDSILLHSAKVEERYAAAVGAKLRTFDERVDGYSAKTLEKIIRQEKKMKAKMARVDSLKADRLFTYAIDSLKKFQAVFTNRTHRLSRFLGANYFSYLDTMRQSLSFYKQGQSALNTAKGLQGRMDSCLGAVGQAEARLATVDRLNGFLQQRQAILQTQLNSFPGLAAGLKNVNREVYYYKTQVSRYKQTLQDPEKIEQVVLGALRQTAGFRQFMSQNSELAGLLNPPAAAVAGIGGGTSVNGLPSGAALRQFMQKQLPNGGGDVVDKIRGQAIDAGSASPTSDAGAQLKSKLSGLQGNGDPTPPDFTPNGQHGRPFGQRLEFGANLQFGGTTQYLPASANFGFQAGYKLNDKCSFGLGAAYTLGMGTGWNHIRFSNQGLGARSYLKWKMKNGFYLQGGGEWNYLTSFTSLSQLKQPGGWQTSALAGTGREFKAGRKLKGSVQLLYDFLWNRHFPAAHPLVFRVGYQF